MTQNSIRLSWPNTLCLSASSMLFVSMLALTGCSSASDQKEVVASFADATGKATDALKTYDQAAAARSTTIVREYALAHAVGVRIPDGDCATSSARCRLVLMAKPNDPAPKSLTVKTLIPEHIAAASEIAAYAAALKELTEADARSQVSTALDKVAASVASLANIVEPGSGVGVKAIAGPSAATISWIYGKYQEEEKLRALQAATKEMDPVIQSAAEKFGTIASFAGLANKTLGAKAVEDASAAFDADRSKANLERLIAQTESYDAVLSAGPATVFTDIANVHGELTKALASGPQSMAEVYRDLKRLASDANALYKIAQDFQKVASQ